jgi:hypothetical protein
VPVKPVVPVVLVVPVVPVVPPHVRKFLSLSSQYLAEAICAFIVGSES